ncbi:hypothetical protein Sjap_009341 [Stephania japonica]|uniref:Cytochrome b561 and DOMON domain-containing protein n=1 Tax=Stephania japonica TaxID=461633 RepID=A0AAP0JR99_9MAGN
MRWAYSFITVLLIFFSSLSSIVISQSDSCNSVLNLNGSVPFETTNLVCLSVWQAQDYILRFVQNGPSLWSFVLSAPYTNAYVAIGFSPSGRMPGSSAVVGWSGSDGALVIKQYYLGDTNPSKVNPDQGELPIVPNSSAIKLQSSRLYLAFQLNTTQPLSRVLYSVGPRDRLPSSNNRLTEHRDKVSTRLNYQSGKLNYLPATTYANLRRGHGIVNMLGWGILMPIGVITARYLRHFDPIWFYSHVAIQMVAFVLGVSGVIAGFVLEDRLSVDVDKHKTVGIFILIFGCLQAIAILVRPDKSSKARKYWNWYHSNVGRVLIIFAIANVFYGIHLGDEGRGWNAGYGVAIALLILVAIGLEVRMWMRK